VVEVTPPGGESIIIANVYDRHAGSENNQPAQCAGWGEIAQHRWVVIAGADIYSIIDPTLSSPEVELNWSMGPATGSDHKLLQWEVLGAAHHGDATSTEMTGWDISRWEPRGKEDVTAPESHAAGPRRITCRTTCRRTGPRRWGNVTPRKDSGMQDRVSGIA